MALTELVIMPGKDYQDICDSVRKKTGTNIVYTSGQVSQAIDSIVGGKDQPNVVDTSLGNVGEEQMLAGYIGYAKGEKIDGKIQSKGESTINPSTTPQYIEPGVYLSGRQTISAIQTETKTVTTNGVVTPSAGKYLTSVTVEVPASGIQLPSLSNPGTQDDLVSGKELIGQNGQKIVGTNPYEKNATDEEIGEQSELIQQIKTALEGKAAGGMELPPLDDNVRATSADIADGKCLYDENGNIVEGSVTTASGRAVWKNIVPTLYEDDNNSIILSPKISNQYLLRNGVAITSPLSNFGNATADQVIKGATFTSVDGLLVEGTHECSGGVTLPELTNPGSAEHLIEGMQLIGQDGNPVTGSLMHYLDTNPKVEYSINTENKFVFSMTSRDAYYVPANADLRLYKDASFLGDATADDVRQGKTFTSAAGLAIEGTAAIGGGYAIKSGTTTSGTINTGLSDVEQFFMYKESQTGTGLIHLHYTKSATSRLYASAWSTNSWGTKTITNGTGGVTVNGGTVTISATQAEQGALTSNVTYKWIAVGTE